MPYVFVGFVDLKASILRPEVLSFEKFPPFVRQPTDSAILFAFAPILSGFACRWSSNRIIALLPLAVPSSLQWLAESNTSMDASYFCAVSGFECIAKLHGFIE